MQPESDIVENKCDYLDQSYVLNEEEEQAYEEFLQEVQSSVKENSFASECYLMTEEEAAAYEDFLCHTNQLDCSSDAVYVLNDEETQEYETFLEELESMEKPIQNDQISG